MTLDHTEHNLARDVAVLRQAIARDIQDSQPGSTSRPLLIMLGGLPGTGKSHFARELATRVPSVVLGSDRLRKALVAKPEYTREEHARVFDAAHQLIAKLLDQDLRVIFDATNLNERLRGPLYHLTDRRKIPLVIVWLTAPPGTIRRRLADRSKGHSSDTYSDADWSIYRRLLPAVEPIARPHFTVDSSRDISSMLDRIVGMVNAED